MVVIIGGESHGKKEFIKRYVNETHICETLDNIDNYKVINQFHDLINNHPDLYNYINENITMFKNKIIIGKDIGLGIVPIDEKLRVKRDEIGRCYQFLIRNADVVIRIWYGTATYLKGDEDKLKEYCSV